MIWIDSSFGVEWLLGTSRAVKVPLPAQQLGILPSQYSEILIYFGKKIRDLTAVIEQLESLVLEHPVRLDLQEAARLYLEARRLKSKASLADAILAAVAMNRKEAILSFDNDFTRLGFKEENSLWRSS